MEQVFSQIHQLRNAAADIQEKYWDGEVTRWFTFEIVSFAGEVHFYARVYHKSRPVFEAAFFSFYPDIELVEAEDYVNNLPTSIREIRDKQYDLWGTEMVLTKEACYPIKSYVTFESPDEEKQFDPIATFLEVLGKVKEGQFVGIQILAAPAGAEWKDEFEKTLEKLKESKTKKEEYKGPEGQLESFARFIARSPGETDVLKAIENNLSKSAFETIIRFIYLSPKTLFYDSFARKGVSGAFNQYGALDLNSFVQNYAMSTRVKIWNWPFVFPRRRNEYRKQRLLNLYRHREFTIETFMGKLITSSIFNLNFHSKPFLLNTESLATLFHPPTAIVMTAPHVRRVESRKATPPAGLPIYGDEKEIEKYQ